ncbi:hypothetical protein Thert_02729 [Thermoanaerobacterium thermosaccharolyticum]|uniref:Uncharacterized protein n=1 Tax=Thermoanaerobacterium thermosaccharolyticum TaxID=1517 RepID=A0A223HX85_THETR|nr:hypothetical protein Thert_00971 [Thermoanaerobacterium thermosaccharolyticum]AST58564.1 hypothetical protein Thert_02729 [Thermoanaerobacterium thermosaccharolyticum]
MRHGRVCHMSLSGIHRPKYGKTTEAYLGYLSHVKLMNK